MNTDNLIAVLDVCNTHDIEISFINTLDQIGLIEVITIAEAGYIKPAQLLQLEKFIRLYYHLDINVEGIETIDHLLQKIGSLQDEITGLKNRLRLYETMEPT